MKQLFLASLLLLLVSVAAISQSTNTFPYKKGEANLKQEFLHFVAEIPGTFEDTAYLFFIQISTSATEKAKIDVFGTNGIMKKRVEDFFTKTKNGWDPEYLKQTNVIIPVLFSFNSPPEKRPHINWNNFFENKFPSTQKVLFVEPIVSGFFGTPVVDKD